MTDSIEALVRLDIYLRGAVVVKITTEVMSRAMNAMYRSAPTFRAFLSEYCLIEGQHMPLADFGISFASFCIERSKKPVSPDVLMLLIDRFMAGGLAKFEGEVVIRLTCTYKVDTAEFEKKFGTGLYDFL